MQLIFPRVPQQYTEGLREISPQSQHYSHPNPVLCFHGHWGAGCSRCQPIKGQVYLVHSYHLSENTAVNSRSCFPEGTVIVSVVSVKCIASENQNRSPSLCHELGRERRQRSLQRLLKTEKCFITAKDTLREMLPQHPLVIQASLPSELGTRTARLRRLRGPGHDVPTRHSEPARQREMGI